MRATSPNHLKNDRKRQWDTGKFLLNEASANLATGSGEVFADTPNQPIEIEIGVGKGTFLLARAKARPEVNFLGIEYAKSYAIYVADRLRRAGQDNARMLCTEAGTFFADNIADSSIMRVHIYFPDPWPKRRHHRRRLIQPDFVQQVRRVLQPGGQLLLVTDHQDYFRHMQVVLNNFPGMAVTEYPNLDEQSPYVVGTNFERKYVEEGRPIFKAALMKY